MENLITLNQHRWEQCKVDADHGSIFKRVADRLMSPVALARYKAVEKKTGVPWWFIAVVHEREASQRWNTQLGQGDPLNAKSIHKPKGRGPFLTWEDGAVDALVNCAPFAARNKDWSIGSALAMLEKYNGLGYYNKGLPSPYIWAGTNQYAKGKYVADGVYSPTTVDTQLGVAGLLKFMGISKAPVTPTGTVIVAAGGGLLYTFWTGFTAHWIAYSLGLLTTAFIVDLAIYLYKNRKTTNV